MVRIFILLAALFLALPAMAKDYPDTDCEKYEKICLDVLGKVAKRSKGILKLTFENKQKTVFKDNVAACEHWDNCISTKIIAIQNGYILVESSFYEGGQIDLFRLSDAQNISVRGGLLFSPQKKWFLALADIYTGDMTEDGNIKSAKSKIYRFENQSIKLEYEIHTDTDLHEISWENDFQINVSCMLDKKAIIISYDGISWSEKGECILP